MVKNLLVLLSISVSFFFIGYLVGINRPITQPSPPTAQTQLIVTNSSLLLLNQSLPVVILQKEEETRRQTREETRQETEPVYQERDLLDVLHQTFYRQALDLLVETMPVSDLVPLTAFVSGFDADFLWQMQHPHSFVKNLVSLYIESCGDIVEEEYSLEPIRFADQEGNHTAAKPSSVFSLDKLKARIYAYFALPADYESDQVLVRWCTPEKNILYGPYTIDRTRAVNYIWWEPFQPEVGDYYVYIWAVAQQPELIALGYYEVLE